MSHHVAHARPRVVHYRERFPVLSETFIRETVSRHQRYESIVLAHMRVVDVPVDGVSLIVSPAGSPIRFTGWATPLRIWSHARVLSASLRATAPAVIHAHFGKEGVIAAAPAARLGIPLVVSFYGYDATHLAQFPMWRRRFTRLFRNAAAVLAEGPHMAARLVALGAPVGNVLLHPIPIGIERFPFRPASPPRAGEPIIFLQACRFVEKKGVDVTIAAFARIAEDVPSAVLWLMGSGPEEVRLRILADETGVGHRITFMAPQPHDEYARTMRMAHIFVHPSRTARNGDGEGGAPTALLEAQALGLPIVATTHADIPAVVDPRAALLGPPDDIPAIAALMLRLSRNSHEWAARAEAGRRQVAGKHDPDRLAGALEDLYDSVRG